VEYGDYECPACGAAYPVISALQEAMPERLRFVFRNFPLNQVHPNATGAALAAEAAGMQGRFWEMHDLLYEHQEALEPEDLLRYAEALGLDLAQFQEDWQAPTVQQRVQHDFLGGARSGVNGTPTFFINGVRHDGPHDFEALAAALAQATEEGE
jgi:protein-disulfide isomerase